ncbi:MAG: hypothetical protein RJB39_619 [Candidatus Parcubacteria bacterium]|jgi:hypothetical protein
METRFQTTSFIPKASLDNVVGDDGRLQKQSTPHHTGSLFTLFVFFVFICSLVAAGVVFSLLKLSSSNITTAQTNLAKYQAKSNAETIEDIKSLNNRLNILSVLVNKHVAVVPLFGEIGRNTLDKVSFSNFSLKRKPDGTFALVMKAQGVGYESIVVQDKQFSDPVVQKVFKNTSITDFNKQKGQDLTSFTVNTTVVENAVNFAQLIKPLGSTPQVSTTTKQ